MKRTKLLAIGCGATLWFAGAAAVVPTASFAATSPCYPAVVCPMTTTNNTPPPPTEAALAFTNAEPTLPFTGADIEQMSAVGATALVLGSVMVARSRRRRRTVA